MYKKIKSSAETCKFNINRNIYSLIKRYLEAIYIIKTGNYDVTYYAQDNISFKKWETKRTISRKLKHSYFKPLVCLGKYLSHEVTHYVLEGVYLGKDLTKDFSSEYYFNKYRDVLLNDMNPYYHFLRYGRAQGKKAHEDYIQPIYVEQNTIRNWGNDAVLSLLKSDIKSVLIFDHGRGGGAGNYLYNTLIKKLKEQYKCVLVCMPSCRSKKAKYQVDMYFDDNKYALLFNKFNDLKIYIPNRIYINELALWNEHQYNECIDFLIEVASNLTMLVHDYFCICPTINLMTNDNLFCGLPNISNCHKCIKNNKFNTLRQKDIMQWRSKWEKLLLKANEIICFSQSSKRLLLKVYNLNDDKIFVRPHEPLITYKLEDKYAPRNNQKGLVIGFIGTINENKGINIIIDMVKISKRRELPIKFVILGRIPTEYESIIKKFNNVTIVGVYKRENLPLLLKKYSVKICAITSVWPETFCYVLQELMLLRYPVVSFDLGAQGERTANYQFGFVVKSISAQKMLNTSLELFKNQLL